MQELVLKFVRRQLGSLVRAALVAFGVYLVQNGLADEETAAQFVDSATTIILGAIPIVASLVWSWYRNRKVAKIVEGAPTPPSSEDL